MTEKKDKYKKLCKNVKRSYKSGKDLVWCNECEEINLWTYWQGRGVLNPIILVVGQDWGCLYDDNGKAARKNATAMKNSAEFLYFDGVNIVPTDKNLAELFTEIDDKFKDMMEKRHEELFFTNIVLGYRKTRSSGGLKKAWIIKDKKFMKRLIDILEPEIILCLGKNTYEGVMNSLEIPVTIKGSYNDYIKNDKENPQKIRIGTKKTETVVFALAHPGTMGTLNRNRIGKKTNGSLKNQHDDWAKVKKYYEAAKNQ